LNGKELHFHPCFNYAHFEYDRLIRYYYAQFGRENVLVLPFELFKKEPLVFATKICKFCDLSISADSRIAGLFERQINSSLTEFQMQVLRHANFWIAKPRNLSRRTVFPLLNRQQMRAFMRWLRKVDRIVPTSYTKALTEKKKREIALHVGNRYKVSNRETVQLTGLDLEVYGYDL